MEDPAMLDITTIQEKNHNYLARLRRYARVRGFRILRDWTGSYSLVDAPMKLLGIDPGIHGGLAIIELNDGAVPQLIDAIDIPTVGTGVKERVDVLALRAWIQVHRPDRAGIERGQAMPKQGSSSGFKFGRACGALEAVLACCEIPPLVLVEPSVWKRARHFRGGDKEGARQLALQIFAHALFARRKDHQRAEATLIALHVSGRA
jgi:crossover junction endodeoxyribonuclease RuvC